MTVTCIDNVKAIPKHTKLMWLRAKQAVAALQQCTVLRATHEK